eukprot:GHVP01052829.1.p1 GENE.GHVP01052829.1~~GHVP01052829.1.p1  ORF type:complete len:665 (-),score=120.75 GHVP01052829.1:28-1938(-)
MASRYSTAVFFVPYNKKKIQPKNSFVPRWPKYQDSIFQTKNSQKDSRFLMCLLSFTSGKTVEAILDCGAETSVFPNSVAISTQEIQPSSKYVELQTGGTTILAELTFPFYAKIGGLLNTVKIPRAAIAPEGTFNYVLLGQDFLEENNCILDFRNKMMTIGKPNGEQENLNCNENLSQEKTELALEEMIKALCLEFSDIFCEDDRRLPRIGASVTPMPVILLDPSKKVYHKNRKHSAEENDEIRSTVERLLDANIIEPCATNGWCNEVLFVPKKDGSKRMCIDFTTLNANTKKDVLGMPLIDNILQDVSQGKIFSALDMISGYHQVLLEPNAREYSTFRSPLGLFRYKRIPFGMSNAPRHFQKVVNETLKVPIEKGFVRCYLDDIVVYSENAKDHIKHLNETFKCLRNRRWRLKTKKCIFGSLTIPLLGFQITHRKIFSQPSKLCYIDQLATPSTIADLRSQLGLLSFFRRFLSNFAPKANNWYQRISRYQLHKDEDFVWSVEDQNLHDELKAAISSVNAKASPPDPKKELHLFSYFSSDGLAGALALKEKEVLEIALFASRSTTAAEKKYGESMGQFAAVVWMIEKHRPWLRQSHGGVVIHISKESGFACFDKAPNQTISKWLSILLEFKFEICFE